jgi:hypothetical protein
MSPADREYNVKRGEGTHVSKLITNRNVRQIRWRGIVTDGMRRSERSVMQLERRRTVSFTMYPGTLCTEVCLHLSSGNLASGHSKK